MSERDEYTAGVPCWIDTLQPDPVAAADFYGALFGWEFDEPTAMPGAMRGSYLPARVGGRLVAGIGQAPDPARAATWSTYICVASVDEAIIRIGRAGGTPLTGAMEAGAAGRLAVVSDACGVAFGVWEAGERAGAERVNEPGTWAMSSLHTDSLDGAQAFYGAVFGWQLERVPDAPIALWRLPGYSGGAPHQPIPRDVVAVVTPTDAASAVPPHWAINFRVDDVDATAERAIALEATLLMPPVDTPGFRSAVLADPQGGVVAVSASATSSAAG
jgi:predicted enzyme related to lactoylglutathione lyase